MATQIKSLLGYTLLKANKKVDLDDEQHEASIGRGDIFGVTQRRNSFFVLDIDLKPLALHEFEVSKAEYVKISNSATLVLSGLDKVLSKTRLRGLYKPTGERTTDYQNNSVRSAIASSAEKGSIAIDRDSPLYKNAKNLPYNLVEVPLYAMGNATVEKGLAEYKSSLDKQLSSIGKIVEIKPKLLKKDSNVITVTGVSVIAVSKDPVSNSKRVLNRSTLQIFNMLREAIDHVKLSAEYSVENLSLIHI